MSRSWTGVVHVHSRISYDGRETIADLASFFRKRGRNFMCITEHSDGLSQEDMDRIVEECRRVSGPDFLALPGVEFSCIHHLHILGIGVVAPLASDDPFEVVAHIRMHGGVVIIAHPCSYEKYLPEGLAPLVDGIEVWSLPKDGKLGPGSEPLGVWTRWRTVNPTLRGFGAIDLHRLANPSSVAVTVQAPQLDIAGIQAGLRSGPLVVHGPVLSFSGEAPPGAWRLWAFRRANEIYQGLRRRRKRIARKFGREV